MSASKARGSSEKFWMTTLSDRAEDFPEASLASVQSCVFTHTTHTLTTG
eukprot:CAMPEP_0173467224 /NCGR_PEP_ID=MMETSP1357-20121228/74711_1 /TAXON_ID=77926 /ORGANISM="Hemiselmis rufescens, Strain PCC563" /LENGTH=48 /DNA_ID= /DNA_START= /DNA_END= /DNA_ORIENTATION=